ncbi:predicted protein [Plenodomus lingam JN3]|uniref:Predicted protein n=1 Tax=Leptosphaeria maculans (strain JN3 / isolate v23.1.3 / race Av1-4-5-6-7-8) TaxID=985895 RepID=E5AA25_LEPMJ|nr:predicted protein [Plenodomus lingam JN3]CBY00516.1 predicted protein [Plenodomus lingam JN3]
MAASICISPLTSVSQQADSEAGWIDDPSHMSNQHGASNINMTSRLQHSDCVDD